MSIAAKCTCGKSPYYCVGGDGCLWQKGVLLKEFFDKNDCTELHISDIRCMLIDFGIWLDKNDIVLENGNITENVDKFIKSINYI